MVKYWPFESGSTYQREEGLPSLEALFLVCLSIPYLSFISLEDKTKHTVKDSEGFFMAVVSLKGRFIWSIGARCV